MRRSPILAVPERQWVTAQRPCSDRKKAYTVHFIRENKILYRQSRRPGVEALAVGVAVSTSIVNSECRNIFLDIK